MEIDTDQMAEETAQNTNGTDTKPRGHLRKSPEKPVDFRLRQIFPGTTRPWGPRGLERETGGRIFESRRTNGRWPKVKPYRRDGKTILCLGGQYLVPAPPEPPPRHWGPPKQKRIRPWLGGPLHVIRGAVNHHKTLSLYDPGTSFRRIWYFFNTDIKFLDYKNKSVKVLKTSFRRNVRATWKKWKLCWKVKT